MDQALLRYRKEEPAFRSDIVFIGYMSTDLFRGVSTYRPFLYPGTNLPSKARFVLSGSGLAIIPNPIPGRSLLASLLKNNSKLIEDLGKHDYFYQTKYSDTGPLDFLPSIRLIKVVIAQLAEALNEPIERNGIINPQSEAFRINSRILDTFYREVLSHGSLPIILLFPNEQTLQQLETQKQLYYAPIVKDLKEKRMRFLPLEESLGKIPLKNIKSLFKSGHYSPAGNALVADAIATYLKNNKLLDRNSIRSFIRSERQRLNLPSN